MLQPTDLDSPNEALSLLNSMPSATEWNLFLQEGSNSALGHSPQDKEFNSFNPSYQYNPLTLGIPEPNWNNVGMPSFGYHSSTSHYPDQEAKKGELLMPVQQESEPLAIDKPQDFQEFLQISPRLNKDCRAYNSLQYSSCSQECYSYGGLPNDEMLRQVSSGHQNFQDDARYEFGKLTDFGSDLTNMINYLPENVDNELLKVVDSDEESDIIVEESDTESEISISDVGPYLAEQEDRSKLSCIVCGMAWKDAMASNFSQVNHAFPLTFMTKTPVVVKLVEIIPVEMQNLVKFERVLMCRRCLNLIDTAENLECKLIGIKQELCSFISRTFPSPNKCEPYLDIPVLKTIICDNLGKMPGEKEDDKLPNENQKCDLKTTEEPKFEESSPISNIPNDVGKGKENEKGENGGHYQCDRCGRTYLKKNRLFSHLAKHSGSFKFKCQHCERGFMKESNLQIHLRTHKTERKFQCQHCPASYLEESQFATHVCVEKRFMCDLCPKIFATKEKFDNHYTTIHRNKVKNICKVCSKEFKHPSDLVKHMTTHEDEKKQTCPECGKGFKIVSQLNQHIKIVHRQRYTCSLCDSEFRSSKELREHNIKEHKRSDKFYCDKCNKSFAEKRYLTAHEKTHLGTTKVNTCPICHKTFKYNMKSHMMSHAAEKQFHCERCDVKFTLKNALDKHNRLKHPEKEPKVN